MNELGQAFALLVCTLGLLGLMFLFQGDPDLWDLLLKVAMEKLS